jgi:hypothetical protein
LCCLWLFAYAVTANTGTRFLITDDRCLLNVTNAKPRFFAPLATELKYQETPTSIDWRGFQLIGANAQRGILPFMALYI